MTPVSTPERLRTLRVLGMALALSTPISGIVSFAIAATLFGEDRFEGPDGLSALGWLAVALPAVAGLVLIALTYRPTYLPRSTTLLVLVAGLAGLSVILGLWSVFVSSDSGDPSIGGGLLVLVGVPVVVLALRRLLTYRPADPPRNK